MSRISNVEPPVGRKFGRWTVLGGADPAPEGVRRWSCRCVCGTERKVRVPLLLAGRSKSCGCTMREISRVRANPASPIKLHPAEYRAWAAMKGRVFNSNNRSWARYGGRGCTVHPAWVASFETFLADVGPRPSDRHSLVIVDVDGHYVPGNVAWQIVNPARRDGARELGKPAGSFPWRGQKRPHRPL